MRHEHLARQSGVFVLVSLLVAATGCQGGSSVTTPPSGVQSVTVSPPAASVTVGSQTTLSASVVVTGGASQYVNWSSSDVSIAQVAGAGLTATVTGVKAGLVTIRATSSQDVSKSGSAQLTVTPKSTTPATVASWSPLQGLPSGYLNARGTVRGLWSAAGNTVYAVTDLGYVGAWNGVAWTVADKVTNASFGAIGGSSAQDVYVVGSAGTVRHFDGSAWSAMTTPTSNPLLGVWASSTGRAFAVGAGGTIVRLAGGTWTSMASGFTGTLWSVWGSSETNVFAVGDSGVVLRFNGTTWSRTTITGAPSLFGVWGRGSSFAVAVGLRGTIATWNGSSWQVPASNVTAQNLYAVSGDSATGIMVAVGASGAVLLGSGTAPAVWTSTTPPLNNTSLFSAWRNDATGVLAGTNEAGVVLRSPAGAWSILTFAPQLNSVAAVSATAAFAGGDFGTFAQLSGGTWQTQFGVGGNYEYLLQLYAASATQVYGTRFSGISRFDGTAWTSQYAPGDTNWLAVGGTGPTNLFVAGLGGFARYDGMAWSKPAVTPVTSTDLVWNFAGAPSLVLGIGWNVGSTSLVPFVIRWRSGVWDRTLVPSANLWFGVSVVDSLTAFAVGMNGSIYRYDGVTWTAMNSGITGVHLNGVWAVSANEAYAVGDAGTILWWNGSVWSPMQSGTTASLQSISGVAGSYAVAVGEGMTILMGRPALSANRAFVVNSRPATLAGRSGGSQAVRDATRGRTVFK
jgi:hypothetical protein